MAIDFEADMINISTLLTGTTKEIDTKTKAIGDGIKQIAKDTGTSTAVLSAGTYEIISAFGEQADAMGILEIANKTAAAGNATTKESVGLLSAVTKGYGDTSTEATKKASDLAFQTVKLGQTSIPELSSSMGKIIPVADTLNVSQEELFGTMATLTGVTGNTAEVSTQLSGVFSALMKPSTGLTAALDGMGYASGDAAIESLGFQGTLDALKDSVGGNETKLNDMFGSVQAGTAVLALTGSQSEAYTEKLKDMEGALGATDVAFEKQQASVGAMMGRLKEGTKVLMMELGEKFLPLLETFLKWVMDHMPEIKATMKVVFEKIGEFVNVVIAVFRDHLLPIFVAIFDWTKENWPTIQKIIEGVFKAIKFVWDNILKPVLDLQMAANKAIVEWVENNWGTISSIFETVFENIKRVWDNVLKPILDLLLTLFKGIVDFVTDYFAGMQTIIENTFEGIGKAVGAVADAFGWLSDKIKAAWDWLNKWNKTDVKDKTPSYGTTTTEPRYNSMYNGSHANGLDNVPFDGYIAKLHKNEGILTAEENKDYQNGGSKSIENNFNISSLVVREEADIKKIAKELFELQQRSNRGRGIVTV